MNTNQLDSEQKVVDEKDLELINESKLLIAICEQYEKKDDCFKEIRFGTTQDKKENETNQETNTMIEIYRKKLGIENEKDKGILFKVMEYIKNNRETFNLTKHEKKDEKKDEKKGEFQETLEKNAYYLDLCNYMGYKQLNDVICEYAEKIRNCDIIDFNKFLSENNGSPIWNHLELLEENLNEVNWYNLSLNPAAIHILERKIEEEKKLTVEQYKKLKQEFKVVNWYALSLNPAAIHILEREIKEAEEKERDCRVRWNALSANPAAVHLLEMEIKEAKEKERDCRVDWNGLSANPAAIHLLEMEIKEAKENNRDCRVDWNGLSENPAAIHLLEQNLDKVNWYLLSANPAAIHLLEQNLDKVNWYLLSANPAAIHLLEQNLDKVNWFRLSQNPAAIHLLNQNLVKVMFVDGIVKNPAAIHLLNQNLDKFFSLEWLGISENPAATHLLKQKPDKVNWVSLSKNPYEYLKEKLLVLETMRLLPKSLNTDIILQTYIQSLKKKGRYDDYIIYSDLEN